MQNKIQSKISDNRLQGKRGEEIGLQYFLKRNYQLIKKNYKSRFGEVDLILIKNKTVFFIEFKTVSNKNRYFDLEHWQKKQMKNMIFAIKTLINKNIVPIDVAFQIELVVIDLSTPFKVVFKRYKYELENHDF